MFKAAARLSTSGLRILITFAGSKEQRRRIHLSLRLSRLAQGLTASALAEGACLPGCVTSVEDHGYLLLFGIQVLLPPPAPPALFTQLYAAGEQRHAPGERLDVDDCRGAV